MGSSSPPDHDSQKSGTGVHRQNQQQRGRTGDMTTQFRSLCSLRHKARGHQMSDKQKTTAAVVCASSWDTVTTAGTNPHLAHSNSKGKYV